jgi:hypothetical protein
MLAFDSDCDLVTAVTALHGVAETDASKLSGGDYRAAVRSKAGWAASRPIYRDHSHPIALVAAKLGQTPLCRLAGMGTAHSELMEQWPCQGLSSEYACSKA